MEKKEQLIRNFLQELEGFVNYKISAKSESHQALWHSGDKKDKKERHNLQAKRDRQSAEKSWDRLVECLKELVK